MAAAEAECLLTRNGTIPRQDVTCQFDLSHMIVHLCNMCGCAVAARSAICCSLLIPTAHSYHSLSPSGLTCSIFLALLAQLVIALLPAYWTRTKSLQDESA